MVQSSPRLLTFTLVELLLLSALTVYGVWVLVDAPMIEPAHDGAVMGAIVALVSESKDYAAAVLKLAVAVSAYRALLVLIYAPIEGNPQFHPSTRSGAFYRHFFGRVLSLAMVCVYYAWAGFGK